MTAQPHPRCPDAETNPADKIGVGRQRHIRAVPPTVIYPAARVKIGVVPQRHIRAVPPTPIFPAARDKIGVGRRVHIRAVPPTVTMAPASRA